MQKDNNKLRDDISKIKSKIIPLYEESKERYIGKYNMMKNDLDKYRKVMEKETEVYDIIFSKFKGTNSYLNQQLQAAK